MDLTLLDKKYRKVLLALAPVFSVALISLNDTITSGQSLGVPLAWAQAVVAVLAALGVYLPANPVAKFLAAFGGAVGAVVLAALTDNHLSQPELLQISIAFMTVFTVGAVPNKGADADDIQARHLAAL